MSVVKGSVLTVLAMLGGITPALAEFGREDPDESWLPAGFSWNNPRAITVNLTDNRFQPDDLALELGKPYKLVMRNVGQRPHDLVDPDFYHSIVIKAIVSPSGTVTTPHIHSLSVQPGTETIMYFVGIKPGYFDVFCSIPGHREDGMEGRLSLR